LEADVSTLAPRQVDFFVAKSGLESDVHPFPTLAEWPRIAATEAWQTFERTDLADFDKKYGVTSSLEALRAIPSRIRGLDPLKAFGGRDLAIAGSFRGAELAQADWAAYGRVSWLGKLGVSLLRYPKLLKLDQQGLRVTVEDDQIALEGGTLPRKLYVTRIRDVVIVATSDELVKKARELEARGGQDSFGQSALYFDNIERAPRSDARDELELYVDYRTLAENLKLSGRWPDAGSPYFTTAFLGRLFQLGSLKSLAGVAGFHRGIQVDLRGDLSSELISPVQKRLYQARGAERPFLENEVARLARSDTSVLLFVQTGIGDLLREMLAAAEPALRTNIEDLLRATGEFPDTNSLIKEFEALFKSRAALIIRPNDYPYDVAKDPPNDGRPMPAWCLVLWTDGSEKVKKRIDELHKMVILNQGRFGIEGRNPGEHGVFTNKPHGYEIMEFWSKNVPGTGHIATCVSAELYLISNSFPMTADVLLTHDRGSPSYPPLSDRPGFAPLLSSSLAQANVMLWIDPRSLGKIRRQFAQRAAEDQVRGAMDWKAERARLEDKYLRERFPGKKRGQLDEETQTQLNDLVNPEIDAIEEKLKSEQIPAVRARLERQIIYSESVSDFLALFAFDPKNVQVSMRAIVPMDR
jgi:hypothetical protein